MYPVRGLLSYPEDIIYNIIDHARLFGDVILPLRATCRQLNKMVLKRMAAWSKDKQHHPFSTITFTIDPSSLDDLFFWGQQEYLRTLPWELSYSFLDTSYKHSSRRLTLDYMRGGEWLTLYELAWGALQIVLMALRGELKDVKKPRAYLPDRAAEVNELRVCQQNYTTYLLEASGRDTISKAICNFHGLSAFKIGQTADTPGFHRCIKNLILEDDSDDPFHFPRAEDHPALRAAVRFDDEAIRRPSVDDSQYTGLKALVKTLGEMRTFKPDHLTLFAPEPSRFETLMIPAGLAVMDLSTLKVLFIELSFWFETAECAFYWKPLMRAAASLEYLSIVGGAVPFTGALDEAEEDTAFFVNCVQQQHWKRLRSLYLEMMSIRTAALDPFLRRHATTLRRLINKSTPWKEDEFFSNMHNWREVLSLTEAHVAIDENEISDWRDSETESDAELDSDGEDCVRGGDQKGFSHEVDEVITGCRRGEPHEDREKPTIDPRTKQLLKTCKGSVWTYPFLDVGDYLVKGP